MRVLLIQKNFHPNTVGQLQGLRSRGHDVRLIVQYSVGTKSGSSSIDVETLVVGYGRLSRLLWRNNRKRLDMRGMPSVRELAAGVLGFRPDVMVAKEVRTVSTVAFLLGKLQGARVVLSWEKPKMASKRKYWKIALFGGLFLPRLKFHMGHFGHLEDDVPLGASIGTSRLLPYPTSPLNLDESPLRDAAERDRVHIVTIGSLNNQRKRLPWVTRAVIHKGLQDDVLLTYIGLGDETSPQHQEIRAVEDAYGLERATILLNLPHSEVMALLPSFDLFAFPARNEPFGAVVPEAMSAGLPVICSTSCGSRVYVEHGLSGLVFETASFESFATSLEQLVQDETGRSKMSRAAFSRVAEELNPGQWALMFERLVCGAGGDPQRVMSSGEPPG